MTFCFVGKDYEEESSVSIFTQNYVRPVVVLMVVMDGGNVIMA